MQLFVFRLQNAIDMKCIHTRTREPRHPDTNAQRSMVMANKEQCFCLMPRFFQNNTFRRPFRRTHRNECVDLVFEMCLKYFECVGSCEHRLVFVCGTNEFDCSLTVVRSARSYHWQHFAIPEAFIAFHEIKTDKKKHGAKSFFARKCSRIAVALQSSQRMKHTNGNCITSNIINIIIWRMLVRFSQIHHHQPTTRILIQMHFIPSLQ